MNEIWKDIPEYEGLYQASNLGRIKSLKRNGTPERIMNQRIDRYGYCLVDFRKRYERKTKLVHRLIALTFIENLLNKREVNHISLDKTDNRVINLEWADRKENMDHYKKYRKK